MRKARTVRVRTYDDGLDFRRRNDNDEDEEDNEPVEPLLEQLSSTDEARY